MADHNSVGSIPRILKFWINDIDVQNSIRLSGQTVANLIKVINATTEDYLLISNAGGQEFHIWVGDKIKEVIDTPMAKDYVLAYQVDGIQVLDKDLIQSRTWFLKKFIDK